MRLIQQPVWAGFIALMAICAGCGGRDIVKVSGVVTMNEKPLPDVMVRFNPIDKNSGRPAYGVTNSNGRFVLTTFEPGDGCWVGRYKVTVHPNKSQLIREGVQDMDEIIKQQRQIDQKQSGGVAAIIPLDFRSVAKTPLKQVVPPDGEVKIELKATRAR